MGHAPHVYRNPDGIYMVTSKETPTDSGYFLGLIRFEAPKDKEEQLKTILSDFRGPKQQQFYNDEDLSGIASFIKEETPYEAGFI